MHEHSEELSPQQGWQVIQSMIEKAKNQYGENGHLYLIWGWVVLICSIAQFVLLEIVEYEKHYLVWMSCWIVLIYQVIYLARKEKRKRVKTYTHEILGFVWLTFIFLMFLFGFLFGKVLGGEYYRFINPGFLALYGMPTFLSGIILKFRSLIIGGICCWILSIISAFIIPSYQVLLLGLAVVIAWIIPGYLMRRRHKTQNN